MKQIRIRGRNPLLLNHLIKRGHALIPNIKMRRHPSQIGHRQISRVGIIPHHLPFVQQFRRLDGQFATSLTQRGVALVLHGADTVGQWVFAHSYVEIRVPYPFDGLTDVRDGASNHFGIQMISELFDKVGFDGGGSDEFVEVACHGIVGCDEDGVAGGVELRAAGAAEDLLYVEDAQVDGGALFGHVDVGSFDDDGVCGEVDAPCECCRAA
mmetsp:Transcript_40674/g.73349  ORF Transcript_40674/g.73349 Transcript_40674/m.73349 type:complete len:211 (-) Transcript_40674:202-834(-)